MLVRLMIASWEFQQFIEICKEYNETIDDTYVNDDNDNIAESKIDDDVNDNDSKDYK
jgi:poly(A) polymerase Pap1